MHLTRYLCQVAFQQQRKYDLVIFGASGFTGRFVLESLVKLSETENCQLKWAVAGRSKSKLLKALEQTAAQVNRPQLPDEIPVIEADVSDEASLKRMALQTDMVLNCVGPFQKYGEPVVKSCLSSGTHHMDVSGEPYFLDSMVLNYYKDAVKKQVFVLGACGWDSVPVDLTIELMRKDWDKTFGGQLNSVVTYLKVHPGKKRLRGNYATWESLITGQVNGRKLGFLRRRIFSEIFARAGKYKQPDPIPREPMHKNKELGSWCVPFLGSDRSVARRTQGFLYENNIVPNPIDVECYLRMPNKISLARLVVTFGSLGMLTRFPFTRHLLLKYPFIFSFGMIRKEGKEPDVEIVKQTSFEIHLNGRGLTGDGLIEEMDYHISGPDPGYTSAAICSCLACIVFKQEKDKILQIVKGGVLSPAAVFRNTTLAERLQRHGIKIVRLKPPAVDSSKS